MDNLPQCISYVIPVYNELANIPNLLQELRAVADEIDIPYEIIVVDDGSTDGSDKLLRELAQGFSRLNPLILPRNRGQSAALAAGFEKATGDVIITMDGDLQNDPHDIPRMLQLYGEYDMVNGWRKNRRDTLSRRLASRIGNAVRNRLTGDAIRDTGCSLKVMRASMAKKIKMYRGLHRFLPTLLRMEGARVAEIPVNHRPRSQGESKYTNCRRAVEGFQDVMAVRWMAKRHLTFSRSDLCTTQRH